MRIPHVMGSADYSGIPSVIYNCITWIGVLIRKSKDTMLYKMNFTEKNIEAV